MKKTALYYAIFLVIIAFSFNSYAQSQVYVYGNITEEGVPVENQEVIINSFNNTANMVVVTDQNGDYNAAINMEPSDTSFIFVQTYAENCYQLYEHFIHLLPDMTEYEINFNLCDSPSPICDIAFFYYEDILTVNFEGFTPDPMTNFQNWTWDFGDGTTGNGNAVSHTYPEEGEYWVSVSATSDECGTVTYSELVFINGNSGGTTNCSAEFYYTFDATDENKAYFFDTSTPADEINNWYWDFGDGEISNEQNPEHTYYEDGAYLVMLSVETNNCLSTFEDIIWIGDSTWYPTDCEALFIPEYDNEDYQTVHFEDLSWGGNKQILAWEWNFGDGNTGNTQNPTHTYSEDGEYLVSLTIHTEDCNSTFETIVFIEDYMFNDCQAMFFPEFSTDLNVQFHDLSIPVPAEYYWEFGDGETSTLANPSHQYIEPGIYTINLFTEADDCLSAYSMDVYLSDGNEKSGSSYIIRAYAIRNSNNPLSVKENNTVSESNISLYPNPIIDELNISIPEKAENVTVSIYSVTGQLISTGHYNDNNISINTSNLSSGVYITKINIDGKFISKRFVK